jgi:preprotein translocase subunit SecF
VITAGTALLWRFANFPVRRRGAARTSRSTMIVGIITGTYSSVFVPRRS